MVARAGSISQNGIRSIFWTLRGRACRVHVTEWNQIDLLDSPWSRVPGPYHRMESDRSFGLSVVARAGFMSQNGIRSIFWTLRGRACRVHVAEWNQIDLLDSPWSRVPGPKGSKQNCVITTTSAFCPNKILSIFFYQTSKTNSRKNFRLLSAKITAKFSS